MLATTQEASEYRKNFHQYYYNKIVGHLAAFENARIPARFFYNLCLGMIGVSVIAGIFIFNYYRQTLPYEVFFGPMGQSHSHGVSDIIIYGTCGAISLFWWIAHKVRKNFENKVKNGILRAFLAFFGDFSWSCKDSISRKEISDSGLIGHFDELKSDDYFEGNHRGLNVVISENQLVRGRGKNREVIFEGLFVKFDIAKKFSTHTVIREDGPFGNFIKPDIRMQEVQLEDVEFNKQFNVYAYDQTEARFLITTAFIERFKNLREVYKAKDIRASFKDGALTIAINCRKDMFKLGDVNKPVADTGEFQTLFEEFVAVLSLVELLKLDSKTGL